MTTRRPAAQPYEIVQTSQEPPRFAFVMPDGRSTAANYQTIAQAHEAAAQAVGGVA